MKATKERRRATPKAARRRAPAGPDPTRERVNPKLAPFLRPVVELKLDPANARTHGERNIEALKFSFTRYGQQKPILCTRDGTVLAGNGMLQAAIALGWNVVAAIAVDIEDKADQRGFALADNRTAELSDWDFTALMRSIAWLKTADYPVDGLGWDAAELKLLEIGEWKPSSDPADAEDGWKKGAPVQMTKEQREVFDRAVEKLRAENGEDISEGRCVELLAAEYLS